MGLEYNKRLCSVGEFYSILKDAFSTMKHMREAKKLNLLDDKFEHRIMLAVTEVNGCRVCSYFHTEQALKDGIPDEDITDILNGSLDSAPPGQGTGLFFAQHYADKRGEYDKAAYDRLVEEYGSKKANGVLAATRMIMMGNAYGIAFGCLRNRLKGNPVQESRFLNEIGILVGSLFIMPVALVHSAISKSL